jgi:hypothetical protein
MSLKEDRPDPDHWIYGECDGCLSVYPLDDQSPKVKGNCKKFDSISRVKFDEKILFAGQILERVNFPPLT